MKVFSRHTVIKFGYILIDLVFIYLSIYLACLLRQPVLPSPVSIDSLLDPYNPLRLIYLLWFPAIIFFNNTHDLYQTRREQIESLEIWSIVKSVSLSALSVVVGIYLLKVHGFPRSLFFTIIAFLIFFLSLWRVFKRWFVLYLVSGGYNNFNALIVGGGKVGLALADEIKSRPFLGIKVVGFLDDFKMGKEQTNGIPTIGKISDFSEIARREFINKVFITIYHDSKVFMQVLEDAREMGIAVRVIPQGFDLTKGDFCKYNIGLIPILEYCDVQSFRIQSGKRLFDFILSLLFSLMALPFFLVLAILIKMDSPGPVFYLSKRYGRRGRMFSMIKFRSMVAKAEEHYDQLRKQSEVNGPIFKIKKDPRITQFGIILRKYSLDELPQLINVMKGDMSLVGPRPLPVDQIEKEDLRQLKRLEVRPGITGLWQIRGRSDISFSRLVKWDVWYINNWSFWLDLNILFQTLPVVLKGKGAY